jgi:hypothetical protein
MPKPTNTARIEKVSAIGLTPPARLEHGYPILIVTVFTSV